MRPDEHKKKRSAQYKKKHGDKVDKAKQTDTQKSAAQNDAQKSATVDSGRTDSPSASTTPGRERESEEFDEWEQQKSFQRRQVVSNWERYEGTTTLAGEDAPALRGADFKAIVEAGGDAFSQFRFRDEQLWETEEDSEAGGDDTPTCLAIDCDQLTAALLCLPLHERLGVDKAAFLKDQVVLFDGLAKTNLAAYEQSQLEVSDKTGPGSCSACEDNTQSTCPDSSLAVDRCSESDESEDILDDILRVTDPDQLTENVSQSDSREHELRQAPTDSSAVDDLVMLSDSTHVLENRTSGDCTNAIPVEPAHKTVNVPCAAEAEHEPRDKLTATAETGSGKDNVERNVLHNDVPQKGVSGIEDELDFLLTLEVPVSNEEKPTQPQGATGNVDSLDDWLDDMIAS